MIRIETYSQQRNAIQGRIDLLRDDLPATREMHPEVGENLMLAIRHLEDARMRLGKVIQYAGDGVSCYDKQKGNHD
ncbi:MAG TPA: hypothetical protein VHO70_19825 [Chitinispirillaceae bacterium]|nr:hypothetical protein [Chitinispirillaceae bacterium]